jgi:lysine biosynthesis enzyme LysX
LEPFIVDSCKLLGIPELSLNGALVLVRNVSAYNSIYVAAVTEASGGVAVNNLRSLILGHDKILSYAMLAKAGIRIPRTMIALDGASLGDAASKLEYPYIDKPPVGSWGRLVSLVKNPQVAEQVFNHRRLMGAPQLRIHVIQKPARLGQDIRCLVVGESIAACMKRIGPEGDWRSNAALGGSTRPYKPEGEVEELSIKAAKTIGAVVAGVDIVYDDEGYYVNEVNVVPEFKALVKTTGVNIARIIVEYIVREVRS